MSKTSNKNHKISNISSPSSCLTLYNQQPSLFFSTALMRFTVIICFESCRCALMVSNIDSFMGGPGLELKALWIFMIFNHDNEKEGRLGPARLLISIKPTLSPIFGPAASPRLPERFRHITSVAFLFLCRAQVGFNKESFLAPAWLFNSFPDLWPGLKMKSFGYNCCQQAIACCTRVLYPQMSSFQIVFDFGL